MEFQTVLQQLIEKGKELDYVLVSEITAYYDEDSEEYAKIIKELISKKISVLEEEPKDEITEEFDASKVEEVSIDDFDNLPPSIKVDDPVRMYLKEIGKIPLLSLEDEKKYAKNDWTHVDFLIYKTIDKSPVLAIEVDGSKYHKEGSKQAKRDELKNTIFAKYDIPLCRFSTAGSNEKEKLSQMFKETIVGYQ